MAVGGGEALRGDPGSGALDRALLSPGCGAKGGCLAGVVAGTLLAPLTVGANEPIYVKNLSPVSGLLGLPALRAAASPQAGTLAANLHTAIASHYVLQVEGAEGLSFDGETLRLALELRYAPAPGWDLQLELPWLQHDGGHLDSLIDSFHDVTGLTDGGRDQVPRNRLDFRYRNAGAGFDLGGRAAGIGDVSLALNRELYRQPGRALSLGVGYAFASGDADELLGSDHGDAWLALRYAGSGPGTWPLEWYGQLGYLWAGELEALAGVQERQLWFAGLGLRWDAWPSLSLLAQFDTHAAPARSGITALGETAVLFSAGLRWRLSPAWALDFTVAEDAQVETGPDVMFQAALRFTP